MPRGNDSRDHPGRRPVDPRITHSQDTDEAPAQGIPRPAPSIETEGDHETDYSDVQDAVYWRNVQKNIGLGLPEDHENPRPPHLQGDF